MHSINVIAKMLESTLQDNNMSMNQKIAQKIHRFLDVKKILMK